MTQKKSKINFNGEIFSSEKKILSVSNRAFLYGDALFETIRMFDGKLPFLDLHINRALKGMKFLKYKIPKKFNTSFFQKEIKKIAKGNARIRITIFREDGGLYTPKKMKPQYLITSIPLKESSFKLNKKGLTLGVFDEIKLPQSRVTNLKTTNSLPYILASIYKREQNLNDCILLNEKGRIAEASSSNVFLLKKNRLITPSLSEGCIEGTMRQTLLTVANKHKLKISEIPLTLAKLQQAEEIWLTNSIQGIRWVENFNHRYFYKNKMAKTMVQNMNLLIK